MQRPFATWGEFAEFVVFLAISIAGVFGASWVWVVIGAMTLFLLGFSRWRDTIAKAGSLDVDYRELGRLAFAARLFGIGFDRYARSHNLPLVLAAKFGVDTLFLTGAFLLARVAAWLWGLDAELFSLEQH
jgi:hypothetical protein